MVDDSINDMNERQDLGVLSTLLELDLCDLQELVGPPLLGSTTDAQGGVHHRLVPLQGRIPNGGERLIAPVAEPIRPNVASIPGEVIEAGGGARREFFLELGRFFSIVMRDVKS